MAKTPELLAQQLEKVKSAEARAASLRAKLSEERKKTLLELHVFLGFDSTHDLIDELERLVGKRRGRPPIKTDSAENESGEGESSKSMAKRKRISRDQRRKVIAAIGDGHTGEEVAEKFNISLSSVNNIKRSEGLVRVRR